MLGDEQQQQQTGADDGQQNKQGRVKGGSAVNNITTGSQGRRPRRDNDGRRESGSVRLEEGEKQQQQQSRGRGGGGGPGEREKGRSEVDERWRMTMPSNPAASALTTSQALAQQRYNQALELEKQLRGLLQSKGPFDPSVRALRNRICESYEAVILEDHEFSEKHEVEQAIWRLHYKCIEEFRARIRKSTAAAATAAAAATSGPTPAPAIPVLGSKAPATRRDASQKILSVFRSFLAEATGFYHNLILKLRAKHGLPQDYSPFEAESSGPAGDDRRSAELRGCDLSCHRCLIFLGDLARYKESHNDADVRSRDWSVAAGYYQQAISLWPSSGNPHNQLAVLATYVGDEMLAVYRYFRSLAVENPFLTARDNLIILFEKNRNHYAQLLLHDSPSSASKSETTRASDKTKRGDRMLPVGDGALKLAVKDHNLEVADIGEVQRSFRIRFVRLNGILFTKTSLETFPDVYSATVHELETLLSPDDATLEAGLVSEYRSSVGMGSTGAAGFLQVIAILVFTVHNISWGPDSQHPSYADVLQRSVLFQNAFTAAFECAGRLVRRCADFKDISKSPLLPAVLVFLEWLACKPEVATGRDVDEKQANARAFFWGQSIALLNNCTDAVKVYSDGLGLEGGGAGAGAHSFSSLGGEDESVGGLALWEDYELRGFVSIVPAQVTLDYSRRAPRIGLGDKRERDVRIERLLAAGKAIANALEGTEKGIYFDEDLRKFVMAGEVLEKETTAARHVEADDDGAGLDEISALPDEIVDEPETTTAPQSTTSWLKDSPEKLQTGVLAGKAGASAFVSGEEEEDEEEEVIVFKPIAKENPVVTTAGREPMWRDFKDVQTIAAATASLSTSNAVPPVGVDRRAIDAPSWEGSSKAMQTPAVDTVRRSPPVPVSDVQASAVTDLPLGRSRTPGAGVNSSQGINAATVVSRSSPDIAGPSPSALRVMAAVPGVLDLLKREDDIGGGKGGTYGYAPSSAEDWLNQMGRPSSTTAFSSAPLSPWDVHSASSMFSNGSEKTPSSSSTAGVIGQPKQLAASDSLWSRGLDTLSLPGFSNLTLGGGGNSDYNNLGKSSSSSSGALGGSLPPSHSSISLDGRIPASVKEVNMFSVPPPASNGILYGDLRSGARNGTIGRSPSYGHNIGGYTIPGEQPSPVSQAQVDKSVLTTTSKPPFLSNGAAAVATNPATTASSLTLKDNNSSSTATTRLSGMKPPPGFGPLPTKQAASSTPKSSSSQPQISPRLNVREEQQQQQVDDYGWLDDYSQMGKGGQTGYYQAGQGSSLYSSDYGIWSSGSLSESTPISKAPTSYPFPGMVVSEQDQLEKQRQQYSQQLLQQLLKNQQKYDGSRADYGREHLPLHFPAQPYEYDAQHQQQQYQVQQHQYLLLQQQQQQQQQQRQLQQQQLQQLQQQQQQQQQQLQQQQQKQQQQPQQQLWYGQYQSRDPFVS